MVSEWHPIYVNDDEKQTSGLKLKLDVLRTLDSEIDFGRGFLQLELVLRLAESEKGFTPKELALALNQRYKAVIDALRKLIRKGIVEKYSDGGLELYRLTEKGRSYYERLLAILGIAKEESRRSALARRVFINEIAREFIQHSYIVDALIAIATGRRGELDLETIATLFNLSKARAQTYLDMYSEKGRPLRLFRRYIKPSLMRRILGFLGINKGRWKIYYRLTSDGLQLYHRMPQYVKFKHSMPAQILRLITNVGHPKLVYRRLALIISSGNLILAILAFVGYVTLTAPIFVWLVATSTLLILALLAF